MAVLSITSDPGTVGVIQKPVLDLELAEAILHVADRRAGRTEILEGTKLGYLISQFGYFHEAHWALDDCFALLELLAARPEGPKGAPFTELYAASQRSLARIFAEHSPFDLKDQLKARGYRWADGSDGQPKSWWIDVAEEGLEDELTYLRSEIYCWEEADPLVSRLTAFERFRT